MRKVPYWPFVGPKLLIKTEIENVRPMQKQTTADPVAHLVAWHDGDHRAAIETLLEDVAHLRMQLALATAAMSAGYTRGWMPNEERDAG